MTFGHWLHNTRQHIQQRGVRVGGRAAASEFYAGAMLRLSGSRRRGNGAPFALRDAVKTDATPGGFCNPVKTAVVASYA